jgi:hypothetical protein
MAAAKVFNMRLPALGHEGESQITGIFVDYDRTAHANTS